jgi:hypothetical protein
MKMPGNFGVVATLLRYSRVRMTGLFFGNTMSVSQDSGVS